MQILSDVLHAAGQYLKIPCTIILLLLMAAAIVEVGYVLCEAVLRLRRKPADLMSLVYWLPGKKPEEIRAAVERTSLLKSQKKAVFQLLDAAPLEENVQVATASYLLEREEASCQRILAVTNLVIKLGPIFGLLGTLIPLGPGIVALGRGDTATLSAAMNYAFDTTIAGLISAAVCSVISLVRKKWYKKEMADLELLMEGCLAQLKEDAKKGDQIV